MKKVLIISAIALTVSSTAIANKVTELEVTKKSGYPSASRVDVYSSNGEKWNRVDKTTLSMFFVGLRAKCRYEGKGNKAYKGYLGVEGFEEVEETIPADHLIPHSDTARRVFRYVKSDEVDPVKACNVELEKRLSKDSKKTRYEILAEGLSIDYPSAYTATYGLTCYPTGIGPIDSKKRTVKVNAVINCQASDLAKAKIPKKPVPVKVAKLVQLIKKVDFAPKIKNIVGTCPAQVEFNGKITVNRAGNIEYQYVSHDGRKSPKFKLAFDKAGSKKLRVWKRTINKEKNPNALRVGSGKQDEYDYRGWYRIDILSPKGIKSVRKGYTLTCQDAGMKFKT